MSNLAGTRALAHQRFARCCEADPSLQRRRFLFRIEPDLDRAKQQLIEASKPGFLTKDALAITEASVLMAQGNHTEAREKILKGRQLLITLSGTSRESLAEILDEIEALIAKEQKSN